MRPGVLTSGSCTSPQRQKGNGRNRAPFVGHGHPSAAAGTDLELFYLARGERQISRINFDTWWPMGERQRGEPLLIAVMHLRGLLEP